jgi:hypothetical protein
VAITPPESPCIPPALSCKYSNEKSGLVTGGKFLTTGETLSFERRTALHEVNFSDMSVGQHRRMIGVRYISKQVEKNLVSDQTTYNIALTSYIILRNMELVIASRVRPPSNTTYHSFK